MTPREALEKLISVRHHCFVRGIIGQHPDGDFRAALRTVNALYVELQRTVWIPLKALRKSA